MTNRSIKSHKYPALTMCYALSDLYLGTIIMMWVPLSSHSVDKDTDSGKDILYPSQSDLLSVYSHHAWIRG